MPSIETFASRDRKEHASLDLGTTEPLEVVYYPNRITTEPFRLNGTSTVEQQAEHDAKLFCTIFASWDLTGPLINVRGETVVADGDIIPIDPDMIRIVPPLFRMQIMQALGAAIGPKASASPPSRKRSSSAP